MAGQGVLITALITSIGIGRPPPPLLGAQQARRAAAGEVGGAAQAVLLHLPAFAAIVVYLVYPAIQTFINSFGPPVHRVGGPQNYADLFTRRASGKRSSTRSVDHRRPALHGRPGLAIATWPTGSARAARRRPRRSSSCRWRSAWSERHDLAVRLLRRAGGPAPDRPAERHVDALGKDPVAWLHRAGQPQQPPAHGRAALVAGRLLDGAAVRRREGRAAGHPGGRPHRRRQRAADLLPGRRPADQGTIITVYITVLIGVMKVFDIVYVMTNGNFNTNVLGNEFWNQLSTNFNNGAAAASW